METATWGPTAGWEPSLPTPDDRASLVLAFGTGEDVAGLEEPLAALGDTWSGHAVLGCSTPAHLCTARADVRLVVTVARFERTTLRHCHLDVARAGGPRSAGRAIAAAMSDPALRGVVVIGDGHAANGASLAAGFAERLPGGWLAGGFAGEGDADTTAWTLVDGACRTGHVSAVGFVGEHLELGFGVGGGWDVFGPERLVTQSYGNVLYELDGIPALSLYADHLGPEAEALPERAVAFPMAIRDLDDRRVVRAVWSVNPSTDSLRFAGDIPQGAVAQLLQCSPDRLIDGAHSAAEAAATGGEQLALAVSCVGRRLVLGDRASEELEAALEALDPAAHVSGFYSLGSLSPAIGGSDHHNQMMTITTVREHTDAVAA